MTLGAKGETAVKLGRGGTWPSTHADAVAVAELAANPRFASILRFFPAKPIVALSYLDPSARFCRRFSIARSSFTMVGNHMARSGVDSGEGVRNAGDASRHAINKRAPKVNKPDLVAGHSGYMARSSSPKLVVCYAFNRYHPARTAEGAHLHPISDLDICRASRLLRCHVVPFISYQRCRSLTNPDTGLLSGLS